MTRLALEPLTLQGANSLMPRVDPMTLAAIRASSSRGKPKRSVTPEEERSLLGSVLGGVEYIGSTLDKPGAAVRGVVHGLTDLAQGDTPEWGGGLLNLIPFSDTMGITDREDRVSGRDVLENVGVLPENKPGLGLNGLNPADWDWQNLGGDLAGFATEVAMDPLSYITGPLGTITKAGKAKQAVSPVAKALDEGADLGRLAQEFKNALPSTAAAVGQNAVTPISVANQIRAGERGIAGIKAPRWLNKAMGLEDVPIATLGAGSETAAKLVERLYYGGKYNPMIAARALFGGATYNKWTGKEQKLADLLYGEKDRLAGLMEDLHPKVVEERTKLLEEFTAIGAHTGMEQPEIRRAFDDVARELILENPNQPLPKSAVKEELLKRLDTGDGTNTPWLEGLDDLNDRYYGYFNTLRETEDSLGKYAQSLGLSFQWLKDEFADHYGRRPSARVRGDMWEFWKKREDYLRDVPGATITANAIGMDPLVTATERVVKGTTKRVWEPGQLKGEIAKKYANAADAEVRNPWDMSLEEYVKRNPHDITNGSTPTSRAAAFDSLPDDAEVYVFHATDDATADQFLNGGIVASSKPQRVPTQDPTGLGQFGPGNGLGAGVYVGSTPVSVSGYGKRILALKVRKGDIAVPPEQSVFGKTPGAAIATSDAHIIGDISPENIIDVSGGKYMSAHEAFVNKAASENIPVTASRYKKVARKPAKGTQNQFKRYDKAFKESGAPEWERTMLPHPDDDSMSKLLYQKHYLWDFYYKPALEREIEKTAYLREAFTNPATTKEELAELAKRGSIVTDPEAFMREQAEKAWNATVDEKGKVTPAKLDQIIEGFKTLPESVLENGLFDRSTATDYYDYMHSVIKAIANQGYAHGALRQPGIMKLVDNVDNLEPGESMLNSVWYNSRLTKEGLRTLALDGFKDQLGQPRLHPNTVEEIIAMRGEGKTVNEIAEALGRTLPDGMTIAQGEKAGKSFGNGDAFLEALDEVAAKIAVPDAAKGLLRATTEVSSPKFESKLLDAVDKITNAFKSNWTLPFPSFHVRNLFSAGFQMMTDGKIGPAEVLRGIKNAYKQAKDGTGLEHIDEIVSLGVTQGKGKVADFAADEALANVYDVPQGPTGGIATAFSPKRWKERTEEVFGEVADDAGLLKRMGRGIAANLNPIAGRGMKENVPANVAQEAGEKAYNLVEFIVRGGYYDELRKAGYSPSQATHYVNRAHFDYGNALNPFEKGVMKRAMPFFAWTKLSLPYTMAKILEYPGGPTAQTFRAVNRGEQQEGVYTPRWMQEQISAPVTGTPDATTFVRSLGLPIEDYNKFVFNEGVPNAPRMMETFAASAHPAITFPLEQISGKQMYSGRELKTLESPTENMTGVRIRPLDVALSRGPWSRAVSTGLDIVNPKKPLGLRLLNLLSGVKTSTVDTEKARMIDLVNTQREKLDDYPEVRQSSHYYLSPRYAGTPIGEARQEDLALLNALERLQRDVLRAKDARRK